MRTHCEVCGAPIPPPCSNNRKHCSVVCQTKNKQRLQNERRKVDRARDRERIARFQAQSTG
jgi:predicted nucleic acid-binding Zn ribbon protein